MSELEHNSKKLKNLLHDRASLACRGLQYIGCELAKSLQQKDTGMPQTASENCSSKTDDSGGKTIQPKLAGNVTVQLRQKGSRKLSGTLLCTGRALIQSYWSDHSDQRAVGAI